MMLETGIKGKQTITVNHEQTAAFYGSGALEVFATPAMIALLEETAWKSVQPFLDAGCGTVGTRVDVFHLAATPLFKGIPDFRQTRIKMLQAETVDELFEVMEYTRGLLHQLQNT